MDFRKNVTHTKMCTLFQNHMLNMLALKTQSIIFNLTKDINQNDLKKTSYKNTILKYDK